MVKEIKLDIQITCDSCGSTDHKWWQAYYEEYCTLKKAGATYITWCDQVKGYVIKTISV